MVFYFVSRDARYKIYMGRDKIENEELIKYGLPEDIWFHVDNLSSAHVYLRLPPGTTIDDVPEGVLEDCAQLVKANSISGNKKNNIVVVYTPWANLKKTRGMEDGQVGFHNEREVRNVRVEKRINEIVNRLNKTKSESYPDLASEKESRNRELRAEEKAEKVKRAREEQEERIRKKHEEETRNYTSLMKVENMTTNDEGADLEDDFM